MKKTPKFKYIDLFCGIGGFHQALDRLGGRCVLASDIDENCRKVYEKNYKIKPYEDIRKLDIKNIPDHDLLAAGFPCQPFSKGGQQEGFKDQTRGTLFYEIIKILEVKKPRFIALENVRNIVTHDQGNTWKVIINSLHELGYRVSSTPLIISPHLLSEREGGAPQVRERVLILGERVEYSSKRGEVDLSLNWEFNLENYPSKDWNPMNWDFKKWLEKNKYSELDLAPYKITKEERKALKIWGNFLKNIKKEEPLGFPIYNYAMRDGVSNSNLPKWKIDFHKKNYNLYKNNKEFIDKWREKFEVDNLNSTKQKLEWQAQDSKRKKDADIFNLLIQIRPSGIRVKKPTYVGALVAMVQTPIIGWEGRRLTPSEAGMLQGFKRDFKRDKNDQLAYKQFGNAVNVNVIHFSVKSLFKRCQFK